MCGLVHETAEQVRLESGFTSLKNYRQILMKLSVESFHRVLYITQLIRLAADGSNDVCVSAMFRLGLFNLNVTEDQMIPQHGPSVTGARNGRTPIVGCWRRTEIPICILFNS